MKNNFTKRYLLQKAKRRLDPFPLISVLFIGILMSATSAMAQPTEAALPEQTTTLQTSSSPQTLDDKARLEVYSETLMIPSYESAVTQTRMRIEKEVFIQGLYPYFGVTLERELSGNPRARFVEDSLRPHIGLSYRAFWPLSLWAEYNSRYAKDAANDQNEPQADPRLGIAYGFHLAPEQRGRMMYFQSGLESYAESVWILRIKNEPVTSGHLRPFIRKEITSQLSLDGYTELYGMSSPHEDSGRTRTEARLGLRAVASSATEGALLGGLRAELFLYRPFVLTGSKFFEPSIESLMVIGGTF